LFPTAPNLILLKVEATAFTYENSSLSIPDKLIKPFVAWRALHGNQLAIYMLGVSFTMAIHAPKIVQWETKTFE
jgi:hypothetical protein